MPLQEDSQYAYGMVKGSVRCDNETICLTSVGLWKLCVVFLLPSEDTLGNVIVDKEFCLEKSCVSIGEIIQSYVF